jgi:EAL domain-containing protein (putative c-di-GMP-specific phosphodiesterase class I)
MAINLSAKGLPDARLSDRILGILARHGVDPHSLVVELTETATFADQFQTGRSLRALAKAGVLVSVDDFGTGHSSLSRLRDLPVRELKIDRSFVVELAESNRDHRLIAGIVALAKTLGLEVVAEGVETEVMSDQLVALGVDQLQGYLIARPMDAASATRWIEAYLGDNAGRQQDG